MINAKNRAYRENNPWQQILSLARSRAKKNNMEFDIQKNDVFIPNRCPILDIPIYVANVYRNDNSISIDRINNSKGYTKDNVIIISWRANRIKSTASLLEMKKVITSFGSKVTLISAHRSLNTTSYIDGLWRSAKKRAKQKGMEFSISRRNIIVPNVCPILGIDIDHGDGVFTDNSPSIDRIDNSVGYVPSNIRVISRRANTLKNNASLEEYSKIYEFYTAIASKREEAVYLLQQTLDQD